jgi:hypothetical protein
MGEYLQGFLIAVLASKGLKTALSLSHALVAFGRLQSSLPKALESLFDQPSTPWDFIEIGYLEVSYDTFLD